MFETMCLAVIFIVGTLVVRYARKWCFSEPNTLAEDLQALSGMNLSGAERKAVAYEIQAHKRLS